MRDCDVVQLAKRVLQRAQLPKERSYRARRKVAGKEIAPVTQAFQRDAQPMAPLAIPPVDTVGVLPQTYIAISEAAGVPNNGDMHIKERIHLAGKDILHVDLEIAAPKVLTQPWKTTRIYFRQRARKFDIVEGVCLEAYFKPDVDKAGNSTYLPIPHAVGGNRVPPE